MTLTKQTPRPTFSSPPGRILIIKPSAIGDVVHALPILNLLRKRWPTSSISWLVTPACSGLLVGHPQLDEIIPFDRKLFGRTWKSIAAARGLASFGYRLRQRKFDLVIDLQGLFRSGLLSILSGAPMRIGSTTDREFGWMFSTHLAPVTTWKQHALDRYLTIAEFIGLGRAPVEFVFATDDADRNYITQQLATDEPYAVLLPGTNWETKRWPVEKFAAMVKPLREKFGLLSVLAGAPDAAAIAPQIPGVINLAGKTTLRQLTALLERAAVVIAGDTGPMHIASALNRPMVTMFGPTSPLQTGPFGRLDTVIQLDIACAPCFSRRCSHRSCLVDLGIQPVLQQVAMQLKQPVFPRGHLLPSP
jgi:lipopolysaccharide heptosyltransferase I